MGSLRTTGLVLVALALVAGGAIQFLPWKHVSATIGATSGTYDQGLWALSKSETTGNGTVRDTVSYFNGGLSSHNAALARVGGPAVAVSVAVLAAGFILALFRRSSLASAITLTGAALLLINAVVFFIGLGKLEVHSLGYPTMDVGWSFYIVILGSLVAAGGGLCFILDQPKADDGLGGFAEVPPGVADRPRHLKCPKCGEVNLIPAGTVPVCASCGHTRAVGDALAPGAPPGPPTPPARPT